MSLQILTTKLYIPVQRNHMISRPHLMDLLDASINKKLTLISASAGAGKTTLVAEWISTSKIPITWLSLDKEDNDAIRFLSHVIAAMQRIEEGIGRDLLTQLQAFPMSSIESILTSLINKMTSIPHDFILVLDDYHFISSEQVNNALTFLLEKAPPQMHLLMTSRENPNLPLARLRVQGELNEIRDKDLHFTLSEAEEFLNQSMNLHLSLDEVSLLQKRTEGWIAGLQLAAISIQGRQDFTEVIRSFSGKHQYMLDFFVREVLQQQPKSVQKFLLYTSILDQMCDSLCDALVPSEDDASGQETLVYLERLNLFIIPLDNERKWYRYHHLFAELLREQLKASLLYSKNEITLEDLHIRASQWFESNHLEMEALHHAAAASDVDRAARLIEGNGFPLHFRGAVSPVLTWLTSIPSHVLNSRPSLWVIYASALLMNGQLDDVESKLVVAENSLKTTEDNIEKKDLLGHIAAIRASLGVSQHKVEMILTQSLLALEFLHPENLPVRTSTIWTLGYAYQLKGDHAEAFKAYTEAIRISSAIGHQIITITASIGLGNMQEANNQLHLAAQTYHDVLQLVGEPPLPIACEAHLGLARIFLEWNDLESAELHILKGRQLARQLSKTDREIACDVLEAGIQFVKAEVLSAASILARVEKKMDIEQHLLQNPMLPVLQVMVALRLGNLTLANQLADKHECDLSKARVLLFQGDTSSALKLLKGLTLTYEKKGWGWEKERLSVLILQILTLYRHGNKQDAKQRLIEALFLANDGEFIRTFVNEGTPIAELLSELISQGMSSDYLTKIMKAFDREKLGEAQTSYDLLRINNQSLIEPLTQRELEIVRLIADGLSNKEISEKLFITLSTVKGHNLRIFGKLLVQRRTEAVARARELGLLD